MLSKKIILNPFKTIILMINTLKLLFVIKATVANDIQDRGQT